MNKYIPLVIATFSGVIYHISSKQISNSVNPFFSLAVTYGLAAILCLFCFCISGKGGKLCEQIGYARWSTYLLGISLPCLEFGWIMVYKAGWEISVSTVVYNTILALILFTIGILGYKEHADLARTAGVGLCICGIMIIYI